MNEEHIKSEKSWITEPSFARKMAKAPGGREHNKSNVNVAKDGKLISFLNESISTL